MMTATYESTVLLGTTSYRVVASADPDLVVELTGVDTSGALVAEGALRLPADSGVAVGRLLGQVLGALGRLGAPGTTGRGRPANANQPWSAELDGRLRASWLAAGPGATAAEVVRAAAREMGRSAWSIRARLARVGCDPDVPGRALAPAGAGVLGVGEPGAVGLPPPAVGVVVGSAVGPVVGAGSVGPVSAGLVAGLAAGEPAVAGPVTARSTARSTGAGAGTGVSASADVDVGTGASTDTGAGTSPGIGASQGADQGVAQGQA
ncbi:MULTISPECIES: hypothetical protein [Actinosynnema]|uniref:hypothetical protein n=1 Tax=Actinosynnema TaxID=40566 RepID=UPI0020A56F57|nr:hypothetical protein [Actinosynnema pretiosum]MCP2092847.1 hypothetical protein [Actinosynnema pretiosum]